MSKSLSLRKLQGISARRQGQKKVYFYYTMVTCIHFLECSGDFCAYIFSCCPNCIMMGGMTRNETQQDGKVCFKNIWHLFKAAILSNYIQEIKGNMCLNRNIQVLIINYIQTYWRLQGRIWISENVCFIFRAVFTCPSLTLSYDCYLSWGNILNWEFSSVHICCATAGMETSERPDASTLRPQLSNQWPCIASQMFADRGPLVVLLIATCLIADQPLNLSGFHSFHK